MISAFGDLLRTVSVRTKSSLAGVDSWSMSSPWSFGCWNSILGWLNDDSAYNSVVVIGFFYKALITKVGNVGVAVIEHECWWAYVHEIEAHLFDFTSICIMAKYADYTADKHWYKPSMFPKEDRDHEDLNCKCIKWVLVHASASGRSRWG